MNAITRVSDITAQDIAEYLRIAELSQSEEDFLQLSIGVAIDYILKYTGIKDAATLDSYNDMVIVVFVLCQDMYDTRALYVDNSNVNKVVENVLGLHQRNLL
jgi:hypothetical protein